MIKKTIAGVIIALSVFAVVAVPTASADAISDLLAQIAALTAQINALKGGAAVTATFNADLTIGSSGADVTALQNFLIGKGFSIPAGATGYFGTQTQGALAAFQAANGITPAAGYFGPITRAKVNGMAGTTGSTGSTGSTSTTLSGSDGSISDVDELSSYNNEEVGEGQDDVKVLGMDVEASNDGDIAIKSVKVSFVSTGNAGDSNNLDDYVDSVSIFQGSKEIGSADVDEFDEGVSGTFTKTITVSGAVIEADETETFYVAVSAVNSFDSGDIDNPDWNVDVESIRFEDGSGVVTTDTTTGDIDGMDVAVDFVSFGDASDTEFKISTASDTPDAGIVAADSEDNTDDVSLLKGKIKLEGTSDVVIDEFPVTFTVTGTAGDVSSTTASVTLKLGSESFTESVSAMTGGATASITFDNLDFTVEAGETVTFEVLADINDFDTVFVAGDTLKASVTASNRNVMDLEDEEGDAVASADRTGTATGNAQEFREDGISVTLVGSPTAVSNLNDAADTGTFTIKYKVEAFGDTVYIASLAANAITKAVYDSNGVATTASSIATTLKNETDTTKTAVGNFEIEEGSENAETFTVTITVPNGTNDAADQYYAAITGIKWDTSDDVSPANTYSSNLDEFQTPTVYLDNA